MTSNSEFDAFWSSKVTAIGVRLNDAEEWSMADKLLAPMQLFALHKKHVSSVSDEDMADFYIPIDRDELYPYIPTVTNGWTLPKINFKTDRNYKLTLDEFRKEYLRHYSISNRCPKSNHMATWETILKYWRQAANFFLWYWAMHNDFEKLDAISSAIDVIKKKFFQHQDLEKYCKNVLLPDFKKKMTSQRYFHRSIQTQ
jgi:hypothetical protein